MARQYSAALSLLLLMASSSLLFVVSKGAPSYSEKISLIPKRHVRITNDLGEGRVLNIHCKSKDDDLGIHNLSFHSTFEWEFRSNAFAAITLFYCDMWWGNHVKGSFDVYRATRDDNKCTDCKWSIRTDGWYWFDAETNKWDLMYRWPKP
ncbi:S-protein homolog 5-like [Neltuma alba]|uniref:S-protein homolog 5-like n=1 Tax=Neltuma alba TaxID=207710 RepID=UPI0010A508B2|nr:S-protein homolog 5-like [Prosopis alba]XP_028775055.1 S-protein homolog 5-like [Prosopis alba]